MISLLSHCCEIDKIMIAKAASVTKGAGGSSHLDTDQFRHMLLCKKFKTEAKEPRDEISVLARTLASSKIHRKSIKTLTNCRLILLNKNPDISKVSRRIMRKA